MSALTPEERLAVRIEWERTMARADPRSILRAENNALRANNERLAAENARLRKELADTKSALRNTKAMETHWRIQATNGEHPDDQ